MKKFYSKMLWFGLFAGLCPGLSAPAISADGSGMRLRGSVISTWSFMNFPGLYYIPTTPEGVFEQIPGASVIAEYGAYDDGDGRYYVASLEDYGIISFPHLTIYDTDTWEEIGWPDCDHSILCTDNAVDPTDGSVYGCYYHTDEDGNVALAWAEADYPAGTSRMIRQLSENEQMYGVACSAEGQYYAILADGRLVSVDKATGELTDIGDTGLRPYYTTSAAYDDKSENIYFSYAPATGKSSLWRISPADATAELLVDYVENEQITALEVLKPEADDFAPAAPVLTAEAPGGEMELTYTIDMPTTLFNGTSGSGSLRWILIVDGVEAASGESQFGATVSGSCMLDSRGVHTVVAYAENEIGRSPRAKLTVINGVGVPRAPEGLGINNFGGGEIGIYWWNVTESADGAYIDPNAITYTVSRNGEVVAEGLVDTWYEETLPIPSTFMKVTYEVVACYGENISDPAEVSTGIGSLDPPYSSRLGASGDQNDSGLYTLINSNGDAGAWWFSPSQASFVYDYSTEYAADDWLISPAFRLQTGKIYELSYNVAGNSTLYTERYGVSMGVAPVAMAMVTELLAPTEISTERYEPIPMRLTLTPRSDGEYYFGWHALSDAGMFQIHVSDIRLSAPMSATSPDAVDEITLLRNADGELRMTGTCKAPATDISGNMLSGKLRVSVTREGKDLPVAELLNVVPGSMITFEDTDIPAGGTYTYHVICTNAAGDPGRDAKASAFVGPLAPGYVENLKLVETSVPGRVTLSWNPPAEDEAGHPLKESNLTYIVYKRGEYGMAEPAIDAPIRSCEITLDVCSPEEKDFALFYVTALNMGVESAGMARTRMMPVGKSETLPFRNNFTESDLEKTLVGYEAQPGTYGNLGLGNRADNGVTAPDGDDSFLNARQYDADTTIDFFTGKIDLSGAEHPVFILRHYVWSDTDMNSFTVYARRGDNTVVELASVNHGGGNAGWNVTVCPLDEVKGETVSLGIVALFRTHDNMPFDAFFVGEMPEYDMAVTGLAVPSRIEAAKEFEAVVNLTNMGRQKAENYKVELLLGGQPVAEAAGPDLQSGYTRNVTFRHILSPLHRGNCVFTAKVTLNGDGDAGNDISQPAEAEFVESRLPAVTDLSATEGQEGIRLSWSAPATEGIEVKSTEDFEDATPWTEEVDGWTMIDVDGQQIGTLEGASLPDPVAMRTSHSFFVFDSASDDVMYFNPALEYLVSGNSGSKSLVAMYILKSDVAQDDWAISPLLSGEAQTISFYARSFHPEYPDHMEVLYSMKDSTDPADFVSACEDGAFEVPQLVDAIGNAKYQRYEFRLPAGAKRFALRAYNEGGAGFMLMIDDVDFRQANATLAVDHYDVYRNGIRINADPVKSASYLDVTAPAGNHVYNVVVGYNRGLSAASNDATVRTSGIDEVEAAGIRIAVEPGVVIVGGAGGRDVALYSADGRMVGSAIGDCRIAAPAGVYVLRVGELTINVLVR